MAEDGQRARWIDRERAAEELLIDHVEPRFAVHDAIGRDWELAIGAAEREVPLAEGEPVRAKAEWKPGGRLAIRWFRPYVGSVVIEEYELVAEGKRMVVTVRSEADDRHPGFEYQRVYERVAADGPLAAPQPPAATPTPEPPGNPNSNREERP